MRRKRFIGLQNILDVIVRALSALAVVPWMVLLASLASGGPAFAAPAEEHHQDPIVYIRSGRDAFTATLVPDQASGSVPNAPALVETTTGSKAMPFQLAADPQGRMRVNGTLPGLVDGRHSGSVTTLTPDGSLKDRKQLLIFVDSQPPLIERVAPEGDLFPRTAGAIQFRITDPENGSGVSVDPAACDLDVVTTGASLQSTSLSFDENELRLDVFVAFPGGAAPHDSSFSVTVSVQDRAGNTGRLAETFRIRSLRAPVFSIYACDGRETYIETDMEFLVAPALNALALTVGVERQLDLHTHGCFGKDYRYPEEVREIMRRWEEIAPATEAEVVTMSTFFQRAVGERVEVQSAPENISVRKTEDGDYKNSRVSFTLRQNKPASMGDQVDDLKVRVPVTCRIDPSKVDFCLASRQTDRYDPEDSVYDSIPEEAFVYTFETITIPVFQETSSEPFNLRVAQEGDQLAARVRFSPMELMDTGASWFAFLGEKYWFEHLGDACLAKGPAREGTVHYEVGVAHKIAEFMDPEGGAGATSRTMTSEGDIVVCLDPPLIQNFHYDRVSNSLVARIDDQGTPLDDLILSLSVSGHRLEPTLDPETGALAAELPFTPLSVQSACLRVTDLAKQTTTDNCRVFGEAEPEGEQEEDAQASVRKAHSDTPNTHDVDKVLGTTGEGKAIVEICENVLKWGYYRDGRFVPVSSGQGSIRLVQLRARDPKLRHESSRAISKRLPLIPEIMGERYDRGLYEPIPQSSGGVSSIAVTGSTGNGRAVYFVVMARDGGRNIPIGNTGFGFGHFFKSKEIKECRTEERDILAPVICPAYDPSKHLLKATLHDHGMPLSELEVAVTVRSDSSKSSMHWGSGAKEDGRRPVFSFQNGSLTSQFTPPPQGECFILRIDAKDKAGNRSFVDVDVVIPREPPEVSLTAETRNSKQFMTRGGVNASAYLTAEARDDSRVVPEKTTLWLDEQILRPFTLYSHTPEAGWRSQFNYKAGYVAGVEEGPHLARFRATDAAGLWAETTVPFDFQLAPYIYDFKVMPDAVRRIGGPALTAMILDLGGDLAVSGLSLAIDGQSVDTSHVYFDPSSGYFSVDGPLELADGPHRAEITATDSHGNQASASLRFTRAAEITTAYRSDGRGVFIESLSLMELENHNGDGQANPGELVRLFVTLRNDTDDDLACVGRLASEDLDIAVETESVDYGLMAPGSTGVPVKGFDLRIGRDILDKTIGDPYETHFDLSLDCGPREEVVLPLTLPIHRPSIPIETGMTITLERLPPTTSATALRIEGTVASTAEFIDWMALHVNGVLQGPLAYDREGGRFEATVTLEDGANTIEVSGADSNGARGSAAGYLFRTVSFAPPTIRITSPGSGDYFVCDNLTVTGTYDAGSGSLGGITVDAPWAGGDCPVTIIDGSSFIVDCGEVVYGPSGSYDIEATITTTGGVRATDTITIRVGDCS
mgnify:CR=1 FL=1